MSKENKQSSPIITLACGSESILISTPPHLKLDPINNDESLKGETDKFCIG